MLKRLLIFRLLLISLPGVSLAATQESAPMLSYRYNEKAKPIGVRALVNIEELMRDCEQDLISGTVDKLGFRGATVQIEGFRLRAEGGNYLYINLDSRLYDSLPRPDLSWIATSLKEHTPHNRYLPTLRERRLSICSRYLLSMILFLTEQEGR